MDENIYYLKIYFVAATYLMVGCFVFHSSNELRYQYPVSPTALSLKLHGDGTCNFDSNAVILSLLCFSFFPSLLLRLFGVFKYRHRDPLDFNNFYTYILVFHNATYGLWTLYFLGLFMDIHAISINCKQNFSMSMINFEIALICGCFSAVNVLFVVFCVVILVPILLYQSFKDYRRRHRHQRKVETLMEALVQT